MPRRRTWSSAWGTRYTDFTTASKWLFKDTCKFVNINVSEFQALKMDAVPVVADAKDALPRLLAKLDGYKAPYTTEVSAAARSGPRSWSAWTISPLRNKKSWKPIINDANADSAKRFAKDLDAGLCQTTVLGAINAMMSEGDVAIGAAGSLPGDMQRMWRPTGIDCYNMEYGYSTMGYEIAGALGVKLAIGRQAGSLRHVRRRQLQHAPRRAGHRCYGAQEDQHLPVR